MHCHPIFRCSGHNHELTNNMLIKETVLNYVNEAEFKDLFTMTALEKIETVTSSAIEATSSAIKSSLAARNAVNDLTAQTLDFVSDAIYGFKDDIDDVILSMGYITLDSFELGATITQRNQALRHAADGKLYRWAGDLPKVVPANSSPSSSGGIGVNAWLEVSDTTLSQAITTGGLVKDSFVKTVPTFTNAVIRSQQDVNADNVHIKDFGAKCDGVTDDTLAFQRAVAAVGGESIKLNLSGKILIKDEILLDKKIWIDGNHADITFDNSEVDANGFATKGLFRFAGGGVTGLRLNDSNIGGFTVRCKQQTPKKQHIFIFDGSYILDLNIHDIIVRNCTGCIFWMIGSTQAYHPGFHNPTFERIKGHTVGGVFGRADNARTWSVGATISHITVEDTSNLVSPEIQICDLRGFRTSKISNIIFEGRGHVEVPTAFLFNEEYNSISHMWLEHGTVAFSNAVISSRGIILDSFFCADNSKIILNGHGHSVIRNCYAYNEKDIVVANDYATYEFSARYQLNSTYTDKRPFISKSNYTKGELGKSSMSSMVTYSHKPEFVLLSGLPLKYIKFPINIFTPINKYVGIRPDGGAGVTLTTVLDATEGRVLKLSHNEPNKIPTINMKVSIPPELVGTQVILAIRSKVVTSNPLGDDLSVFVYSTGETGIGNFMSGSSSIPRLGLVNTEYKANDTWQDSYVVMGGVAAEMQLRIPYSKVAIADTLDVYISDIRIVVSSELPALNYSNTEPVIIYDNKIPLEGYYMQGDIIYNNGTEDVTGWRRKTTGTGNTLGTDWVAFGESATEEIPTLTSGPTAQRPTGVEVGFNYFDTTLAIPIYYKAVGEWVNSIGEVV